jgi:endonuclease-3
LKSFLAKRIDSLEKRYGRPAPPVTRDPFGLVLWENVAYLVDDEKRSRAFALLKKTVGLRPADIQTASGEALRAVASFGIKADLRVAVLKRCAEIATKEFGGDVSSALALPPKEAMRKLRKFPSIGEPGAEKILLFSRAHPVFALESNGLRALLRLGYGSEEKSYRATYRSVREAVAPEIVSDCDWLIRAHLLLKRHGQETCRRSSPACEICPIQEGCKFFDERSRGQRGSGARGGMGR